MPDVRADEVRLTGVAEYESRLRRLADATKATGQAMNESAATAQQAMDGLSESADKYTAALERANRQAEQGFRQASTVGARIGPEAEARMRATVAPPVEPTVTAPGMDAAEMHRRETARNIQDYQAARDSAAEREQRAEQEAARRDFWAAKGFTGDAEIARMERRAGEARARLSADTAEAARMRAAGQALAGTAPRPLAGIAEAESVARAAAAQQRMADVQRQVAATGRAAGASVGELSAAYQQLYGTGTYAHGALGRVNAELVRLRSIRAEQSLDALQQSFGAMSRQGLLLTGAITGAVAYAARIQDAYQQTELSLKGLTGSGDAAKAAMKDAEDAADRYGIKLVKDVLPALPMIAAATKDTGVSIREVLEASSQLATGTGMAFGEAANYIASAAAGTIQQIPLALRTTLQISQREITEMAGRGVSAFELIRRKIDESGIAEAAREQAKSVGSEWNRTVTAQEKAWAAFGEAMEPAIIAVLGHATALAKVITEFAKDHPTFVRWITTSALAFGVMELAVGRVGGALLKIYETVKAIQTAGGIGNILAAASGRGLPAGAGAGRVAAGVGAGAAGGIGLGAGAVTAAGAIATGAAAYDVYVRFSAARLEREIRDLRREYRQLAGREYQIPDELREQFPTTRLEALRKGAGPAAAVAAAIRAEIENLKDARKRAETAQTTRAAGEEPEAAAQRVRALEQEIQLKERYKIQDQALIPLLARLRDAQNESAEASKQQAESMGKLGPQFEQQAAQALQQSEQMTQAAQLTEARIWTVRKQATEERKRLGAEWVDFQYRAELISADQYVKVLRQREQEAERSYGRQSREYLQAVEARVAGEKEATERARAAREQAAQAQRDQWQQPLEGVGAYMEALRAGIALEEQLGDAPGAKRLRDELERTQRQAEELSRSLLATLSRQLDTGQITQAQYSQAEAAFIGLQAQPGQRADQERQRARAERQAIPGRYEDAAFEYRLHQAERSREEQPQAYLDVRHEQLRRAQDALAAIGASERDVAARADLINGHTEEWWHQLDRVADIMKDIDDAAKALEPTFEAVADSLRDLAGLPTAMGEAAQRQLEAALRAREAQIAPEVGGILRQDPTGQNWTQDQRALVREARSIFTEIQEMTATRRENAMETARGMAEVPGPAGERGRAEYETMLREEYGQLDQQLAAAWGKPAEQWTRTEREALQRSTEVYRELLRIVSERMGPAPGEQPWGAGEQPGFGRPLPGFAQPQMALQQPGAAAITPALSALTIGAPSGLWRYLPALAELRNQRPQVEVKVYLGRNGPWEQYTDARIEREFRDHLENAARYNWIGGGE